MEINLTCPVCYSYVVNPFCCENGHALCMECNRRVENCCPVCRSTSPRIWNHHRTFEILNDPNIPCLNVDEGCTVRGRIVEMESHVEFCPKTLTTCVVSGCQWSGSPSAKIDHITDKHRGMFVEEFKKGPQDPKSEFFIVLEDRYMMFVSLLVEPCGDDDIFVYYRFICLNDEKFLHEKDIILYIHDTHWYRSTMIGNEKALFVECCTCVFKDQRLLQDCKIEIDHSD